MRKPMNRDTAKEASLFSNAKARIAWEGRILAGRVIWLLHPVLICCLVFSLAFIMPRQAKACVPCVTWLGMWDNALLWDKTEDVLDEHINDEFMELEQYILGHIWMNTVLPAMMLSTEQLSAVAIQQAMAIGMFLDAEIQLGSQRLLQEIQAQTYKDFQPSLGMCEFGSLSKGLANADIHGDTYAVIFSERSQDRQLGKGDTAGTYGHDLDQNNRIVHFKQLFCNQKDRDAALETVCANVTAWDNDADFNAAARKRMNMDIDYYTLVDKPWTLKIDFSNQEILDIAAIPEIHNEDEEHILAMVANLFGHVTFARPPAKLLANKPDKKDLNIMQELYQDMRAVVAKRSVAENSLFSIASMKAQSPRVLDKYVSGPATTDRIQTSARLYMENILIGLGVPVTELLLLMDENPSYYAQMEILTKKIYQNPNFFTNLYDTPANVERKTVALQAIKLMQKFDMLKSHLRGEANVSILLEMAVEELQREVEDEIQAISKNETNQ
ncbi:MAG: hypothetical protein KAJ29_00070 [Alphaproteobacteria bacterium]|nr:hypothetical protein [Alphaproteobacteria bacterium]